MSNIPNSDLYDANYIQNINKAQDSNRYWENSTNYPYYRKPTKYESLYNMYNNPSDAKPFTDNLKKKGVDTTIRYFSTNSLYNGDGRYSYNSRNKLNTISERNYRDHNSNGSYITFINSRTKTSTMDNGLSGNGTTMGVINPSAGNPIRLNPPKGFNGYIQCLTKDCVLPGGPKDNIVYLSSAPSDIQNNLQVENANAAAIGRSQGFNFFSNVGSRLVSFTFDVYADYLPSPFTDVTQYCEALLQMNYPVYNDGSFGLINSPCVKFVYGGIHCIGIPNITCTFGNTIKKGLVDKATVSVSITETESTVSGKVIL